MKLFHRHHWLHFPKFSTREFYGTELRDEYIHAYRYCRRCRTLQCFVHSQADGGWKDESNVARDLFEKRVLGNPLLIEVDKDVFDDTEVRHADRRDR